MVLSIFIRMDKTELQKLIKQTINEQLIKESLVSLDSLHDGISRSTTIGNAWYQLISGLESVINETKDFKGMYPPAVHGPTPNTQGAMIQFAQILKMIQAIKPVILGMDDIQKKDI